MVLGIQNMLLLFEGKLLEVSSGVADKVCGKLNCMLVFQSMRINFG